MAGNMWCMRVAAVFAADCASAHVCSAWGHWLPWIVLTGAVFFAVVNVPYQAKGMQNYESLYIVTMIQGSNIVSNSLSCTHHLAGDGRSTLVETAGLHRGALWS